MRRAALTIASVVALAVSAAGAAEGLPASSEASVSDRAVVLVATPDLPTGTSPAARSRWHEMRSESSRILGRVADRDGLAVETAIPEIGMLSVELGPGGL